MSAWNAPVAGGAVVLGPSSPPPAPPAVAIRSQRTTSGVWRADAGVGAGSGLCVPNAT